MDAAVGWMSLKFTHGLANTVEDIDRNIAHALTLQYQPLQELLDKESGAVSVVGSGPSLKANWAKMRDAGHDIIACNAACQFLLEKDIVPKYMFCFDADPLMLEFITPHPGITYLLASRCPPAAFAMLKDCKVVCWHANGDAHIEALLQKHQRIEPMIAGGAAAITRCMMLARAIGYTDVHIWGADSSFAADDTHIRKSTTVERHMKINVGGRIFDTAPWMAQQAEDFKILGPQLRDLYATRITVHGDGLIPQIAAALGFAVDAPLARMQYWRKLRWNVMNLYQTI